MPGPMYLHGWKGVRDTLNKVGLHLIIKERKGFPAEIFD